MTLHLILLFVMASQEDAGKLVEQLGSDSIEAREEAQAKLKALGEKAVPALEKAAQSSNLEMASRAKHLLKVIPLMKELTENLRKTIPGVEERLAGVDAHAWTEVFLEATGNDEHGEKLYPGLKKEDFEVLMSRAIEEASGKSELAEVLDQIPEEVFRSAVPAIVRLLRDGDVGVRWSAVNALGRIGARSVRGRS